MKNPVIEGRLAELLRRLHERRDQEALPCLTRRDVRPLVKDRARV